MKTYFKVNYDLNISHEGEDETIYDRKIKSLNVFEAQSTGFDCSGDFSLESLVKNNNDCYLLYYELSSPEEKNVRDIIEFEEIFLTKEKAIAALNIIRAHYDISKEYEGCFYLEEAEMRVRKNELRNKLQKIVEENGVDRQIKGESHPKLKLARYLTESGEERNISVDWDNGTTYLATLSIMALKVKEFTPTPKRKLK